MRPSILSVPALSLAAALVAPGCASGADRLARIEERLDAMDARIAAIDARTQPRLWVPSVGLAPTPDASEWVRFAGSDVNWRFDRAPESWWRILDDGGCVFPLGTRPARIRELEIRLDPVRRDVPPADAWRLLPTDAPTLRPSDAPQPAGQ